MEMQCPAHLPYGNPGHPVPGQPVPQQSPVVFAICKNISCTIPRKYGIKCSWGSLPASSSIFVDRTLGSDSLPIRICRAFLCTARAGIR